MILQRLELEGFLTYRQRQSLDFQGMRLGAVIGPNGEGKSAIFDAVTFALFNAHRAGKGDADQLINQQSNDLKVRLDFEASGKAYRVDRSISRRPGGRSRPTTRAQAYEWDGTSWQSIPEASGQKHCTDWVERTLGINFESFRSSVLLQQNSHDRFLLATPAERQKTLNAILNLDPFRKLEEAARSHKRDADGDIRSLTQQLAGLSPHDDAALASLGIKATAAQGALEQKTAAHEEAKERREATGRYAQALADLDEVEQTVEEQRDLLNRESDIRASAARQITLSWGLPLLRNAWNAEVAAREADSAAEVASRRAGLIDLEGLRRDADQKRQVSEQAASRYQEAAQSLSELRREDYALRPKGLALDAASRYRHTAADYRRQAEGLAAEADAYPARAAEFTRLETLQADVGRLQQYVQARQLRDGLLRQRLLAEQTIADETISIGKAKAAVASAETAARRAETDRKDAERLYSGQAAERNACATQLTARSEAVDEAVCSRCGAPIDREHLELEIGELTTKLEALGAKCDEAQEAVGLALTAEQEADWALDTARDDLRKHEDAKRAAEGDRTAAENGLRVAEEMLAAPLAGLSAQHKERIARDLAYPTDAGLRGYAEELVALPEVRTRAEAAQQASQGRLNLRELADRLEAQAAEEESKVPPEERERVRERCARLGELIEAASELCDRLQEESRLAEGVEQTAASTLNTATTTRDTLLRQVEAQRELALGYRGQRDNLLADVPVELQPVQLDGGYMAELATELAGLADARNELAKLSSAGVVLQQHLLRQHELVAIIDGIPNADRRDLDEAEADVQAARTAVDAARDLEREAAFALRRAEEAREQADQIDGKLREQQQLKEDWTLLESLLGRNSLQGRLVEDARIGIAEAANRELEAISHGTLRIEMERDPQDDSLALRVLDSTSVTSPIDAAFLSGSQRFRVAVALALGIGQYVGGASRGPNAVIIDEGFGSLDTNGVQAMGEHLMGIADRVEQALLVTHQTEMQNYLQTGFRVSKQGGTTTVTRF